MKHRVIAVVFGLSLLAFAGEVQAQTIAFKVQVPFPFVVGNQTLPAGTYQIQRLLGRPPTSCGSLLTRTAVRNWCSLIGEGSHYLAEVHVQGEKNHQIPDVSLESELARPDVSQEEVVLAELH